MYSLNGRVVRSEHTSANLIFHFSNKTEKENVTYPCHMYIFQEKKENGQEN